MACDINTDICPVLSDFILLEVKWMGFIHATNNFLQKIIFVPEPENAINRYKVLVANYYLVKHENSMSFDFVEFWPG